MATTTTSRVLLPRAEAFESAGPRESIEGLRDFRAKRVVLVDDGRPNADVLMARLRELMESRYEVRATVISKKSLGLTAGQPLPKEMFADLIEKTDAAVTGIGS